MVEAIGLRRSRAQHARLRQLTERALSSPRVTLVNENRSYLKARPSSTSVVDCRIRKVREGKHYTRIFSASRAASRARGIVSVQTTSPFTTPEASSVVAPGARGSKSAYASLPTPGMGFASLRAATATNGEAWAAASEIESFVA